MRVERGEGGEPQYTIRGIENDMWEEVTMTLIIEEDGDAIIELTDLKTGKKLEMQFCVAQGGTHVPGLASKFREIAEFLYNQKSQK